MSYEVEAAIALGIDCPACNRPKTKMCVYLPVQSAAPDSRYPRTRETLERVGTPTKRVHWQRIQQARERLRVKKLTTERALSLEPPPEVARLLAAYRAGADWDRRENLRLYTWLRLYSSVLTSPPARVPDSFECRHGVHRADACWECGQ